MVWEEAAPSEWPNSDLRSVISGCSSPWFGSLLPSFVLKKLTKSKKLQCHKLWDQNKWGHSTQSGTKQHTSQAKLPTHVNCLYVPMKHHNWRPSGLCWEDKTSCFCADNWDLCTSAFNEFRWVCMNSCKSVCKKCSLWIYNPQNLISPCFLRTKLYTLQFTFTFIKHATTCIGYRKGAQCQSVYL